MAKNAIAKSALAEAMLIGSDEVAEGALEAFRETGLRVPKDVAVIIYQDIQTLESKWPTGTCLGDVSRLRLGKRAGAFIRQDQPSPRSGGHCYNPHPSENWRYRVDSPQKAFPLDSVRPLPEFFQGTGAHRILAR